MRAKASTSSKLDRSHMFQILSTLRDSHKLHKFKQVRSLFSRQQHILTSDTTTTTTTTVRYRPFPSLSSSSEDHKNETQIDISTVNFTGIAKSVLLKSSHLLDIKKDKSHANNVSLRDLLLDVAEVIPDTVRKFLRFFVLKPEYVLEILADFEFECEKVGLRDGKVGTLWEIFKWVSKKNKGFKHLPRSYEIMASVLTQGEMFGEVESLLLEMERERILLNNGEIFSRLIEGYVGVCDLDRSILMFDRIRGRGLVPSSSCYCVLIDCLVKMKRTHLAYQVCRDMVEMRVKLTDTEKASFENVVRLLCREGKIQESRNLVRTAMDFGLEPSGFVCNVIACGYCEKKDFEDLLSCFMEMNCPPDVVTGSRIVHTLCSIFGVERADIFKQELEHLGFEPDEITFGILIGWSCHEGDLRSAFVYLSEILSRGLNPDILSYNSLISGLFKEGMWKHAKDILDEMVSRGMSPNFPTYRILVAGYCKARQFDQVKMMISKMSQCGLVELFSQEDPLSKAFSVLGLNPLAVRLRRDNDVGFSKAEFFDNLGNGLYLDTDLDEYEEKVTEILENSMIPNLNSLVMLECAHGNLKAALILVDEMIRWGQDLSLSSFSSLVKALCASHSHMKACIGLFEKMPKLADQLDQESLNLFVQACCKKGLVRNGKNIFDGMLQRGLTIANDTCTALLMGLCKKGTLRDLHDFWNVAQKKTWLPKLEDTKALLDCIYQKKMLKESLELLECMLMSYSYLRSDVCHIFLEKLCLRGFSSSAHAFMEELLQRGCNLDHISYSYLIRGLCKEKRFPVALNVLDYMLAKSLTPCWDVSVSLIPHLLKADRLDQAIALRDISLKEQPLLSSSFHSVFIKGFCMTGQIEEAFKLFQDMLSKGMLLEDEVYNMLIEGFCRANSMREVRELLGVMIRKRLSLSISSYRNLVRWMCIEGRVPSALSLKELMHGESKSHNLIVFNILIFHLISCGKHFLVSKVLNDLLENELLLDEVTYNFLVYGFSKHKDISIAVKYLSTMISKGFTPSNRSLRTVISCLCEVGELGKALELSQEMRSKAWVHDSVVQNVIVEGLLSHGKPQEAECFLDQIVEKGLLPDAINYDNLIKRFSGYGRLNKAIDLFNIMLKKGSIPNSASYDSLIHGLCAHNKLNEAMNFHAEMLARDLKPSMNTWNILIHKLCQEGQTVEAERLLISMVHLGGTPTRQMYSFLLDRYCFENNLKKASELMQVMQRSGYNPDFSTHWSLISNLSNSNDKENNKSSKGFLSRLLSGSGFSWRKDPKGKAG